MGFLATTGGFTPVCPVFLSANRIGDKYLIVGPGEGSPGPGSLAPPQSAKCKGLPPGKIFPDNRKK